MQTRSFCYVSDLVSGLVMMLDSGVAGPLNLGNPDERTIIEVANVVRRITRSDSPVEFLFAGLVEHLAMRNRYDPPVRRRCHGPLPPIGSRVRVPGGPGTVEGEVSDRPGPDRSEVVKDSLARRVVLGLGQSPAIK